MAAYYNENDPKTVAWLRALIAEKLIADGEVDDRSITEVQPGDLTGFRQCHFFAGIGGWSYALRLAGWPDDRECWTGSCPCQPWSAAGKGLEADDSRDLWPTWFELIAECRPAVVFGEQVAGKAGRAWLDRVYDDMEARDYALGPVDLPACGVGAFHIRQRLLFVADAGCATSQRDTGAISGAEARSHCQRSFNGRGPDGLGDGGAISGVADAVPAGWPEGWPVSGYRSPSSRSGVGDVADAGTVRRQRGPDSSRPVGEDAAEWCEGLSDVECSGVPGFWDAVEWLPCTDGKSRPVEPGTFPLAHGLPARVGRLRGYGNAIVPPLAAEFIKAYREAIGEDCRRWDLSQRRSAG